MHLPSMIPNKDMCGVNLLAIRVDFGGLNAVRFEIAGVKKQKIFVIMNCSHRTVGQLNSD